MYTVLNDVIIYYSLPKKVSSSSLTAVLRAGTKKKPFITSGHNQPSLQTLPSLGGVFLVCWWIIRNLSWCSHKYFPSKTGKKEKGAKEATF